MAGKAWKILNPNPDNLEAVRKTIAAGFSDPKPACEEIKIRFGIDMTPNTFGMYRKYIQMQTESGKEKTDPPKTENIHTNWSRKYRAKKAAEKTHKKTPERLKSQREWVANKRRKIKLNTADKVGVGDLVILAEFAAPLGGVDNLNLTVAEFAESFGGVAKLRNAIEAFKTIHNAMSMTPEWDKTPRTARERELLELAKQEHDKKDHEVQEFVDHQDYDDDRR